MKKMSHTPFRRDGSRLWLIIKYHRQKWPILPSYLGEYRLKALSICLQSYGYFSN